VRFGPAQVHPQDHLGPVLGLGAACARLDVEIGVVDVHFAREHAPKLQPGDQLLELVEIGDHLGSRVVVIFLDGEFEQLAGVGKPRRQLVQPANDLLEPGTLLSQRLSALGIIPDVGFLQLALDLGQAL
jgi:hypothetical protein